MKKIIKIIYYKPIPEEWSKFESKIVTFDEIRELEEKKGFRNNLYQVTYEEKECGSLYDAHQYANAIEIQLLKEKLVFELGYDEKLIEQLEELSYSRGYDNGQDTCNDD